MSEYKDFTDTQLVDLMKTGNEEAFSALYVRYQESIYHYLLKFVKIPEVAEDLLHEVFLRIWEIKERLDIQASFSAYLYRSCHNEAIKTIKRATSDNELRQRMIAHLGTQSTSVSLTATFEKYDKLVDAALDILPAQRRKVFVMIRQEGKSYNEAAQELGVSINTIKDHLSKASQALKEFIREFGELVLVIILLENIF